MSRFWPGCWLVVALLLAGAASAPAQTPAPGSWRDELRLARQASVVPARHAASRISAIHIESEPNDSVATADSAALGDQATGVVNPTGDVDTWFVDLAAGQFFSVDVDARSNGSLLDATLTLIAPDGQTILAFNDDFDDSDSRISFRVTTSGRYYVQVAAFGGSGFPQFTYAVNFGTVTCSAAVTELEPNDSPATATPMAVGDSVTGQVCAHDLAPVGDVDYWAFQAQAGTAVELDLDVVSIGQFGDSFVALFASDGTTRVAFNDNGEGRADSRLQYSIATSGTYYAAVSTIRDPGGNPFPYVLHVRTVAQGPGDPIVVRADAIGRPLGIAVGPTGDLFVGDGVHQRVVRISVQGDTTTFASGVLIPTALAFDAFGQLLVVSPLARTIFRVTPQGQVTPFITDVEFPFWTAVAPDGRIWITDLSDRSLRRYSATGQFEARFDADTVSGFGPGPLAIGPSGEPYVSSGTQIWRLHNGRMELVLNSQFVMWTFAFDVDGNIYVPVPTAGTIQKFDRAGNLVADPFAIGPDAPQAVAFGRDANGAMQARLYATDPTAGRVIEMNPAGVALRGLPIGFVPPPFAPDVAAAGLLGTGRLSAADVQYLDAIGNHNGRYDVGDLQAYLRTLGTLQGAAASRRPGSIR